jgi:hypothetical protein
MRGFHEIGGLESQISGFNSWSRKQFFVLCTVKLVWEIEDVDFCEHVHRLNVLVYNEAAKCGQWDITGIKLHGFPS